MADRLKFKQIDSNFMDRYGRVSVYQVTGASSGFCAFVYQCRLNLDLDGALTAYGYDNPAAKNSLGGDNKQKSLDPLENWHKGQPGVSNADSQRVGLGNACGDPGDGTKGWSNFLAGNRKFYWAGVKALRKSEAAGFVLDDRAELEAGYGESHSDYFNLHGKLPDMLPRGSGYFPVVQGQGSDGEGYYISTTSVTVDNNTSEYDAAHYLDSAKVPYAVWANEWNRWAATGGSKVKQGDFGIAIRPSSGANTAYVYGDSGTPNLVGESSQKLHDALSNPSDLVTFIAFPGSGTYKMVAKDTQNAIQDNALWRCITLGSDALDLAIFLVTGLVNPKNPPRMTSQQCRAFTNTYAALANWTIVKPPDPPVFHPRFTTL